MKEILEKIKDLEPIEEFWGVWDTEREVWVSGQNSIVYSNERSAKLGLSQKITQCTSLRTRQNWNIDYNKLKDLSKKDKKEFRDYMKSRYVIRRLI